jgi:exopolysaccharide production protein ExoQ
MPPTIAPIIFAIGIFGLLYLDRDWNYRPSNALWIPAAWLFLLSSRPVSTWLGMTPTIDRSEAYLEGSPIDRAVFMVLLVVGLGVVVGRADRVGPLLRKNAPILLFFFYCAVSIAWSDFPFVAFKRWIKALGDVAMVLIILTEPEPMHALKWLITRLGYILFPLSVLFIRYYPNLGRRVTNSWTIEPVGIGTQKNGLGMICLVYGLGFLWYLRAANRDRQDPNRSGRMVAFGTILVMIAWLLWVCDSKSAICSLGIGGGIMLLASRPSLACKRAVVHLLVLTVLSVSVYSLFFDSAGSLVRGLGRDPSLTGRTDVWNSVLSLHSNPWVGTGFESFWLGQRLDDMREALPNLDINESHNGYLEVYVNLGWMGVSLLALLLVTGYRKIIAAFRRDPDIGSLFLAYFLATLFCSFTESAFRMLSTSWFFLLLAVLAASLATSREEVSLTDAGQADDSADRRPTLVHQTPERWIARTTW